MSKLGVIGAPERDAVEVGCDPTRAVVDLIRQCNEDLVLLCPEYVGQAPEFRTELLDGAVQRGVHVRPVWSLEVGKAPAAKQCGAALHDAGMSPRVLAHVPVRAVVADNQAAVVYEDRSTARVERGAKALESLVGMASRLWDRGSEPSEALWETVDKRDVDSRHEVVLRLLSHGLTDDAVARRIGVSVRTVRNDVATAMTRLGARSRFQAGVEAARLGLI